uniref:Uncharacterized protein n=1 Tax=Lotharella globosa TaxID=91324 RepID=A0A7S3ZG00_9EUKA
MDHVRKIEHVITSVFIHLFFNINSKFHISSFKGLNMIRKQNNINSYNYGHFIDVLKNINIPTDYQPIKTIYFLGIIINIIDNTKKIHLINSSLLHFPEKMCFSEDYNSFFSFNKKKINNEFFFNDRVALGFSRSFLRYLHGIFYTEIEYFTLERNSILFFNRISELVVRILLQNTYSDSSIQIRDYREHAEDFTTKSFYNHRWFGYLQLQQKVTPLTDDIQILKDTAIHLTMPSLRFSINPNQDALIQRLEITEDDLDYYRTSEFYTPLIDECAQKLILTSSNYPNLILNQEKKPKNKPIFHDMHESEKNQIIGFSNNFSILDASLITDTIPEGPYHYLDTNDNREDLSELSIENAFSETVENFDSNKNKFIHFSIIKNNTVTTHGISSLNASTHKDLSILLFITFYARILEHSGYHNTITKNLKRLHSVYKTSLYRNYRVQNLSSQNQLYDSAEYLRTAKDEEPHYVTSVEDGNTMSRIDEMESVFEDYYWEGLLLNQSEDTDDYDDEDETYSDDELFFEEINQDFVEAGNALSNLKPENVLGVHAFLYSEDFYETKEDHLERPDITLNTKSNSIMSSLIKDYDYTFPWAELYEAELEKFETDPLENQRMFSHRHLDLLELFSYQKWRQEYFLTKKLQGEEQSEIDILFDYEIRDIFNSSVQLNGIMREDTLNREAFPDEDTLSDEWYEEDPDYSYYYDKLRFQGLNLSDLVILRSQTHPSLNVPVYANLYIDQVAGLSTNLTLIINSCKKLSESAISLISFEAMRSLDAEGSYFSIAHLTTVKAPDDDDDFCCSIHSGISIYKDRFGQSYSYCLLYEEEYMTWDCINTEMTLSNVLHEIPFMITNTFYCDVVIDVDMYFLFEHTGFEIEFSIDKSLDPAVSVEYDLNYIEISPTPDIEMLVILYIYPNFYYYILLLEETEILLPGCFMLLDLISSFISDPLLDNFETHDYYLIDDDHFEPLELYNEVATEEEFRLLMKKNRSSFIKKALQKTWMFITRK